MAWYPEAVRLPIQTKEYSTRTFAPLAIVEHITDGVDSRDWLQFANNQSSVYFLIGDGTYGPDGQVYQFLDTDLVAWGNGIYHFESLSDLTPEWLRAWCQEHRYWEYCREHGRSEWHPGNPNKITISVEHERRRGAAGLTPGQLRSSIELNRWLVATHPTIVPDREHIIGHNQIDGVRRAYCPVGTSGTLFPFAHIISAMRPVNDTLLQAPRITQMQAVDFLRARPNGGYSFEQVRAIVRLYAEQAVLGGIDPLLAVAQMAHETAKLSSPWSQEPYRNPAGIGVTGELGGNGPGGMKGVSFPNWRAAVRAHIGRLLAYALPIGAGTPAQKALIAEALRWRPLPDHLRGSAQTITELTGKWATDGNEADDPLDYDDKVMKVATSLISIPTGGHELETSYGQIKVTVGSQAVKVRTEPNTAASVVRTLAPGAVVEAEAYTVQGETVVLEARPSSVWLKLADGWMSGHNALSTFSLPPTVEDLKRLLTESEQNVDRLGAQLDAARADVTRLTGERDAAVLRYDALVEKAMSTKVLAVQEPVTAASVLGVS